MTSTTRGADGRRRVVVRDVEVRTRQRARVAGVSSTLWEPDAMEQLARELTLRGSAAHRA